MTVGGGIPALWSVPPVGYLQPVEVCMVNTALAFLCVCAAKREEEEKKRKSESEKE